MEQHEVTNGMLRGYMNSPHYGSTFSERVDMARKDIAAAVNAAGAVVLTPHHIEELKPFARDAEFAVNAYANVANCEAIIEYNNRLAALARDLLTRAAQPTAPDTSGEGE